MSGLEITCLAAFGGLLTGLAIALALGPVAAFGPKWLQRLVQAYVLLFRSLPVLLTLFLVYFGVATIWKPLSAIAAGVVSLGLYTGAQLSEVFRGAITSVPQRLIDAGRALGLPFSKLLFTIIGPLAIRRALPSVVSMGASSLKASTLVSALGASELLLTGQQVAARTLLIAPTYICLWAFYAVTCLALTSAGRALERRWRMLG